MSDKDLAIQSYEKKIVNTLREEKYELTSLKRNKDFLDGLSIIPDSRISIANKFYKEQIKKINEAYINEFNELILPLVLEKGMSFEPPEDQINECFSKYDLKVSRIIEKIQIFNKLQNEPFYDTKLISESWGICLDGIENFPFMLALGVDKMIVLDEKFDMNLYFFAALGAMPHISPIQKVGNIRLPEQSYSIDLQLMVGTDFKKISILLLKQQLSNLAMFFSIMNNVALILDTKSDIEEDFSGLKWIKNSIQYSLFKRKEFLTLAKLIKENGLILDKSVSPMQVQKIQALMNSGLNLNIGFEINKLGTIQYSIVQKKENIDIVFDSLENVICRIPEVVNTKGSKFMTY